MAFKNIVMGETDNILTMQTKSILTNQSNDSLSNSFASNFINKFLIMEKIFSNYIQNSPQKFITHMIEVYIKQISSFRNKLSIILENLLGDSNNLQKILSRFFKKENITKYRNLISYNFQSFHYNQSFSKEIPKDINEDLILSELLIDNNLNLSSEFIQTDQSKVCFH